MRRFSEPQNFQNHEKINFDVFEYVVGTLFPDGFRCPGRPLELSKRWISPSRPLRQPAGRRSGCGCGSESAIMRRFSEAEIFKIMKNEILVFSNMLLVVCSQIVSDTPQGL